MHAGDNRSIVGVPFRIGGGFLLLMMLWGFFSEEKSINAPIKYDYEHMRKEHDPTMEAAAAAAAAGGTPEALVHHGSTMPWMPKLKDREVCRLRMIVFHFSCVGHC